MLILAKLWLQILPVFRIMAALYCFAFLYLAAAGPGPVSIDARRGAPAARSA